MSRKTDLLNFRSVNRMSESQKSSQLRHLLSELLNKLEQSKLSSADQDLFVITFKESFSSISSKTEFNEMLEIYHAASHAIPSLHSHTGSMLSRLGLFEEAVACFRCGVAAMPDDLSNIIQLENACCALVERWHFGMLNDQVRNNCYRQAINAAISKGHTRVLDIGTGTGLLALFSVMGGSDTPVYACEQSPTMCSVASAVFRRNKLSPSDIKLSKARSDQLEIPRDISERVSLVVTEIFDAAFFGEGILLTLRHAWNNLLLPPNFGDPQGITSSCGLVLPKKATIYGLVVECKTIRCENRHIYDGFIRHLSSDINVSFICRTNMNQQEDDDPNDVLSKSSNTDDSLYESYSTECMSTIRGGYVSLCDEFELFDVDCNNPKEIEHLVEDSPSVNFEMPVTKSGTVDAIMVYFELDLSIDEKQTVSSRPNKTMPSSWEQAIFPVLPCHLQSQCLSLNVEVGDVLKLTAWLSDNGSQLNVRCYDILQKSRPPYSPKLEIELPFFESMSRTTIRYMNDYEYNFSMCRLLEFCKKVDNCRSVLILSSVPSLLALQASFIGYNRVVHLLRHADDAFHLANLCMGIQETNKQSGNPSFFFPSFKYGPIEGLIESSETYDLIISELFEPYGQLRQQSIEELQLSKYTLLSANSSIYPAKLRVYGCFIECEALYEQSLIIKGNSDGADCSSSCNCVRTCQVHVADFMNLYRVRHQLNVDFHALQHRALSEKILVFDLSMSEQRGEPGAHKSEPGWLKSIVEYDVPITSSGRLCALVYWFEVDLVDDVTAKRFIKHEYPNCHESNIYRNIFTINTLRPTSHFKQSAIMIAEERPIPVIAGHILRTRFVFQNSCVNFDFIDSES